ncbi:hypothetical protein PFISCL1PPCAC_19627, partial [Pristionchus fissidentatus]
RMSDEEKGDAANQDSSAQTYQRKECILWGSLYEKNLLDLENRLAGICDPGYTDFNEHEMSFSLKTNATADVTLRLRRKFHAETSSTNQWRFRYVGRPEPDPTCPVVVRKVIDSVAHSHNMMDFVKTLGLRLDYEYIAKGKVWTCGAIKIVVSSLKRTKIVGKYEMENLEKLGDSLLIELSVTIPDSMEYLPVARQLKTFSTQLYPLVELQKVEYWMK